MRSAPATARTAKWKGPGPSPSAWRCPFAGENAFAKVQHLAQREGDRWVARTPGTGGSIVEGIPAHGAFGGGEHNGSWHSYPPELIGLVSRAPR